MRYSTQVKPISYLKANAAEVLDTLAKDRQPLIITQNGEARAVLQDLATYENTQETLALLKVLALGMQQVEAGETVSAGDAFAHVKRRLDLPSGASTPAAALKRTRAKAALKPKAKSRRR